MRTDMKEDLKQIIFSQNEIAETIQKQYDIDQYVDKIVEFATVIPYYNASFLNGFIAFYANDTLKNDAFLTILIIDRRCKGQGLGKLLLQSSIQDLQHKGFQNYRLEVSTNNKSAISLYESAGFLVEKETKDHFMMNLTLGNNGK